MVKRRSWKGWSVVMVGILLSLGLSSVGGERCLWAQQFTVNPTRLDPYKNFKFRVKWDGRYIPGVSKLSALKRTTEVISQREGGEPSRLRKSPGITEHAPLVMERGLTHDTAFEDWANLAYSFQGEAAMSLRNFRKDILIDFFNEQGSKVLSWKVYRCWVAEYEPFTELDANNNQLATERMTLACEGWERDRDVVEPVEH